MNKEQFKQARLALGLTQEQLANKLGCTAQAVYWWEHGERPIPKAEEKLIGVMLAMQ